MVQWLNNLKLTALLIVFVSEIVAQPVISGTTVKGYKDPNTHENFRKRRKTVSAWQINQLRRGALVVRLPTNRMLINELRKRGEDDQAEIKRLEQAAANLNMMRAFRDNYRFSKVYFIYSSSSD